MTNQKNKLIFDFHHEGKDLSGLFKDPIHIITTKDPAQIPTCFQRIDEAIQEGYYVAGYLSYEASAYFHPEIQIPLDYYLPLLWFGVFDEKLPVSRRTTSKNFSVSTWKARESIRDYERAFTEIQNKITAGVTEQVNYTLRMEADFTGDDYSYYQQLAKAQESDYSAYAKIDHYSFLSASPELFFHLQNKEITTKPMKGTISRGLSFLEDQEKAKWLRDSKKNQQENLLSVHLMMNELEKIAEKESIKVRNKFEIEAYPTVYQMTSTVKAKIKESVSTLNLFKNLFPSSSITGQPKENTMKIIKENEKEARFIYCGALGYFSPSEEAIFNVPIRTVFLNRETGKAIYGVGGAIMSDSSLKEEYDEVIAKAKVLTKKTPDFQLLETIGLKEGEYIVLAYHLERLRNSANYFNFKYKEESLQKELEDLAENYPEGHHRIRVVLQKDGIFKIKIDPLQNQASNPFVSLADQSIDVDTPFIYHKTTERSAYHQLAKEDVFDTLLWNNRGEVTEFTIGNVVVKIKGKLFTPPISSGLLPGTYRQSLLDKGIVHEKIIKKEDLKHCQEIYFINSVREWVKVKMRT